MAERAKTLDREPQSADEPLVPRGRRVPLKPVEGWSQEFLDLLGALGEDEVFERPPQIPVTELKDPFE